MPFNPDAQPASMTLYSVLQHVKDKLACHQHPGENEWCWVDPHTPNADHLPLCLGDVQLWATYLVSKTFRFGFPFFKFRQYTHPEYKSCIVLPNTKHFIGLQDTRHPRGSPLVHTPTELITPVTQAHNLLCIHDPPHAFSDSTEIKNFATSKLHSSCDAPPQTQTQTAAYLVSNKSTVNGEDRRHIRAALDALHTRYPAMDYLQYEGRLQEQGIHYLVIVSMFDTDFYISSVGMVPGAARLFCHWIAEELSRVARRNQSGHGRENISESLDNNEKESIDPIEYIM